MTNFMFVWEQVLVERQLKLNVVTHTT